MFPNNIRLEFRTISFTGACSHADEISNWLEMPAGANQHGDMETFPGSVIKRKIKCFAASTTAQCWKTQPRTNTKRWESFVHQHSVPTSFRITKQNKIWRTFMRNLLQWQQHQWFISWPLIIRSIMESIKFWGENQDAETVLNHPAGTRRAVRRLVKACLVWATESSRHSCCRTNRLHRPLFRRSQSVVSRIIVLCCDRLICGYLRRERRNLRVKNEETRDKNDLNPERLDEAERWWTSIRDRLQYPTFDLHNLFHHYL